MAKLNILGAISTGLIEGGKAAQTYGAMKLKEEYMQKELDVATQAVQQDKLQFIYKENNDEIAALLKGGQFGVVSAEDQNRLNNLRHSNKQLANLMFGIGPDSGLSEEDKNLLLSGQTLEAPTTEEGKEKADIGLINNFVKFLDTEVFKFKPENVMEFMKTLNSLAGSSDILSDTIAEVNSEFPNATEKQIASEVFNRMMSGDYGKGNPNDNQGARGIPLAAGGESGLLSEDQNAATADETSFGTMDNVNDLPATSATAVDPQASEQGLISAAETNTENFSEYRNKTRRESLLKLIANPKTSDKDRKEAEKILSEMGEVISAEEQAYEDARNKAALGGTGATSADMTQEQIDALSRETDRQAAIQQQGYIGSDEAIESLYAVGGPIGEPATTDVLARANVKKESPEVESTKSRIIASLTDLILQAESGKDAINNKFNAVSGNREDPNLTNMTIGEIVDKYGNDAVGAGQFKYKEFTKPMAKKYLGMEEEELKQQVFTRQFQLDMIALGLEDAGLTKIAKGDLSPEKFQKRIANVWRGMPPTKETQIGDPTDELGNKARVSGARYQQHLYNYRNL